MKLSEHTDGVGEMLPRNCTQAWRWSRVKRNNEVVGDMRIEMWLCHLIQKFEKEKEFLFYAFVPHGLMNKL